MKKKKDHHHVSQKIPSNDLLFGSDQTRNEPIILFLSSDLIIRDINSSGAKEFFNKSKYALINRSFIELLVEKNIPVKKLLKAFKLCSTSLVKYLTLEHGAVGKKYSVTIIAIHENHAVHYAITMIAINDAYYLLRSYVDTIINNLPGAVYWKDRYGRYMGCNKIVAEMAGFSSPEDVIGKTDYDLCWYEFADEWRALDRKVVEEGLTFVREEKAKLSTGKIITELTFKTPLKNKENEIIGVIGTSLDISERKEMEAALDESRLAAEAANHAKDVFIQNMSHDIRTPLSGIIGLSGILEEEAQGVEERQQAHWLHVSGEQLLSLLNSVLDIAKEGRDDHVQMTTFSVTQLLHDIRDLELPSAKLKHLDLNIEVDSSTPAFIISDHTKIHRIVLNLLGNALKFTSKGYITIGSRAIRHTKNDCTLELVIKDTGVGIAEEFKNKVFDRFFKITPSSKEPQQGYGVGLNIVQQYLQLLNGEISLESELDVGTTFIVKIPVRIDSTKKIPNVIPTPVFIEPSRASSIEAISVLVIEDNPIALKLAEKITTKAGCRYHGVTNAEEAFKLFKTRNFDLILSDLGLPGMSGNQLTEKIRSYEKKHHKKPVPIVGLTAHAVESVEKDSIGCGMNKIITKPIQLKILQDIMVDFFPESSSHKKSDNNVSQFILEGEPLALFNSAEYPLLDIEDGISNLGDKEQLKELLLFFINDILPNEQIAIRKAHSIGDWEAIENLAHKMKSNALYCGTKRLKFACQHLEQHRKKGHSHLQQALFEQFDTVITETKNAIHQWMREEDK